MVKIELLITMSFMLLAFFFGYGVGVFHATSDTAIKYSPVVENACRVR